MEIDAYSLLREAIIDGRLQPSEHLVEASLTERFRLKPSAVRKALIQLEHEGLAERERFRGVRVRRFSEREVAEILEANAALKVVAIRLAARRATPLQIEVLHATLTRLGELHAEGRLLELAHETTTLHHQLLEFSGQSVIQKMSATLSAHMARFQYQTIVLPGGSDRSLQLQSEIVEAVAAGDEDAAEEAMRRHFEYALQALYAHSAVPVLQLA